MVYWPLASLKDFEPVHGAYPEEQLPSAIMAVLSQSSYKGGAQTAERAMEVILM
jgi:hypothetical protein